MTSPAGQSTGVYLTTSNFVVGPTDNNVELNGNSIRNSDWGVYTETSGGETLDVEAHKNAIVGNTTYGLDSSAQACRSLRLREQLVGLQRRPEQRRLRHRNRRLGRRPVAPAAGHRDSGHDRAERQLDHPVVLPDEFGRRRRRSRPAGTDDQLRHHQRQPVAAVAPVQTVNGEDTQTLTAGPPPATPITVTATSDNQSTPVTLNIAGDVTVNDDTSGSGPAGATCATPDFNNVTDAVNSVSDGSDILICEGTYDETEIPVDNDITIIGNPGWRLEHRSVGDVNANTFDLEDGASGTSFEDLSISDRAPSSFGTRRSPPTPAVTRSTTSRFTARRRSTADGFRGRRRLRSHASLRSGRQLGLRRLHARTTSTSASRSKTTRRTSPSTRACSTTTGSASTSSARPRSARLRSAPSTVCHVTEHRLHRQRVPRHVLRGSDERDASTTSRSPTPDTRRTDRSPLPQGGRAFALNLKVGTYQNISVTNSEFTGSVNEGIGVEVRGFAGDSVVSSRRTRPR